jgi:hypothetical protein
MKEKVGISRLPRSDQLFHMVINLSLRCASEPVHASVGSFFGPSDSFLSMGVTVSVTG